MRDELIQRWMTALAGNGSSARWMPGRRRRAIQIITRAAAGPFGFLHEADLDVLAQEVAGLGAEILVDAAVPLHERREFLGSLVTFYEELSLEWGASGWGFELFWRTIILDVRKMSDAAERTELESHIQGVLAGYLATATDSEPQLTWGFAAFEALRVLDGPETQGAFSSFMERADGPELLRKQISLSLSQNAW